MGLLSGETVCITGKFSMDRKALSALVVQHGGKVVSSVTKACTLLLCEEAGTAKYNKAEVMGIPIHDEAWLVGIGAGKQASSKKAPAKKAASAKGSLDYDSMSASELKAALVDAQLPTTGKKADMIQRLKDQACGGGGAMEDEKGEEDYQSMTAGELKKACQAKGLKTTGKKADLLSRLQECGDGSKEEDEEPPAKKAKTMPAKKSVKAVPPAAAPKAESKSAGPPPSPSKGARPDRLIPGKDAMAIYENYTIKLNQTNIGGNNNKYYIIQLLTKGNSYFVWTRWGRVGEDGRNKLDSKGADLQAAIKGFEKKFKDKTANNWGDRDNFVKKPNKYQLVEVEEGGDDEGEDDAPMGRLTKAQIEKGQDVLTKLETAIRAKNSSNIVDHSSQFFSLIPTNFGRKRPEPIRTIEELKAKEELLKFYLRMGFEDMEADEGLTPIDGVMELPVPATLKAAAEKLCDLYEIDRCVNKGNDLATKKAGNPKTVISKEFYAAILLYTSNAIYRELNKVLRDEKRQAVKKYFQYLRLFLEAMAQLPQQSGKLWRGISVDLHDQYKVGSTITWWGISSTTSEESVARNFMNGCGGKCTLLTIKAKTACDISQITFYANEKESLLAPGTQLKVVNSKRVGNVSEIEMEEVGRAFG